MSSDFEVILAAPCWAMNGVNIFSANLVRGLRASGIPAHVVLTELDSRLVNSNEPRMPLPADLPHTVLPLRGSESWGAHWGAMIRYLEERAPCIYVPNSDWRHSNVSPRLSNGVGVVGVVHSDDPLHYDHVARLGHYWNAIVTTSKAIAGGVASAHPGLSGRMTTIPIGVPVPARMPKRSPAAGEPLRIIYQGGLIQYQKRILDLPRVVQALQDRGIPVELTVVGDGADRERLHAASRPFVEQGVIRFTGVLPHDQVLALLPHQDVYILTSEFEGLPNALGEAMGHGCVPVVTDIRSGIPELVRDGDSGFMVPVGDIEAFADRLARLHADRGQLAAVAERARRAVIDGGFRTEDMVERYTRLFREVLDDAASGVFRRPTGTLRMPPYQVRGVCILEIKRSWSIEGVGSFPSPRDDYEAFRHELEGVARHPLPRWNRKLVRNTPSVAVSVTSGRVSGVDVFSVNLVRGLTERELGATILMTSRDESPPDPMALPANVPVEMLGTDRRMSWRSRWKKLVRYLEARQPCIYVPNYDWNYSCVSPQLSGRVGVVGIVHSDDPMHYEHVGRLGRYWNAIVAVSPAIAAKVLELNPSLEPRLSTIPYGVPVPERMPVRRGEEANAPLRIVYAGRLVQEQKRVRDLLQIIAMLDARGVPFEFTFVGGGELEGELRDACVKFTERGKVRFLGTLANERVLEVLTQADVFVLTSEYEGLPVSLLEAMARGCVPVVTDIGSGIPELVDDGENGYRIPVGDISAFVARLSALQRDSALRRVLSCAAYDKIRNCGYDLDTMTDRYLVLFEEVLRSARSGAWRRPGGRVLPPRHLEVEASWIGCLPGAARHAGRQGMRLLHRVRSPGARGSPGAPPGNGLGENDPG